MICRYLKLRKLKKMRAAKQKERDRLYVEREYAATSQRYIDAVNGLALNLERIHVDYLKKDKKKKRYESESVPSQSSSVDSSSDFDAAVAVALISTITDTSIDFSSFGGSDSSGGDYSGGGGDFSGGGASGDW